MSPSPAPPRPRPGLPTTLAALAQTRNLAAEPILIAALDAPQQAVREGAAVALVERRSLPGQVEILRRLDADPARWRAVLAEARGRMTHALRDALLGTDRQLCRNACQAARWFREYDLMSALITALEDEASPHADLAAETLLALAELLHLELSAPRDYRHRRDPQLVRQHVTGSLEASVARFSRHRRREIVLALLMLANRDNATLKSILLDPHHGSYLAVVDGLLHSEHAGVVRLLLSYIDDPHAPSAALSVLGRRSDLRFVRLLLRKIGFEPGPVAALNLKRMESIAWLKPNAGRLDELDDAEQHSAVVLLMASGMRRLDGFATIERLVRQGQPGGRLAAAAALAQFNGAEANALALAALADVDPRVQAAIVPQLRPRGIPGSLQRLIDLLESPHELVRHAARASLAEFNLEKFLAAFDLLEDEARRSTGALVRKVNPEAGSVLSSEMLSPSRNRRLRAVQAAEAMGLAPEIETSIIGLLEDDDHVVRNAAARALGSCLSPVAHQALCDALADRSVIVQQTAEDSLLRLGHTVPPRPQPREDARS